jgi:hypothetical protein
MDNVIKVNAYVDPAGEAILVILNYVLMTVMEMVNVFRVNANVSSGLQAKIAVRPTALMTVVNTVHALTTNVSAIKISSMLIVA